MLLSVILISLITIGGLSLTYLFAEDEPFLWRICAGNVVGSAVFGLLCFLLACFFGFTIATISLSFLVSLAPLLLFVKETNRAKFRTDWRRAKGKLEGANLKKILQFAYYFLFFIVFYLFFERAIFETTDGIFTGASQNFGDLPFHLGAIFSFTDGQNFPPENPSYAFAKFSYPFMADLITASFIKIGASVREAMFVQNISLAFSLLVVLERFTFKLTCNRLAGKIAPVLLFFSGGLGFLWFARDFWQQSKGFFDFVSNLPIDYTISDTFRWGNSLVVLFITQRSLLLGMPLTIVVLHKFWEIFNSQQLSVISHQPTSDNQRQGETFSIFHFPLSAFLVGLLAGTLPLIHVHSLAVLFVVVAFLFFFRLDKWREWIAFGVGVSMVAIPELIWTMTGSATNLSEFIAWNFGWDKRENNVFWFWLKNTGAFIPILIFGIYRSFLQQKKITKATDKNKSEIRNLKSKIENPPIINRNAQILFYVPFAMCFVIANLVKLAPWEWDNIKVLIYWFIASIPFVALVLARFWEKNKITKIAAAALLIVLTFSGALDVWRTISKEINFKIFDKDAVAVSRQIKQKTAPNALFLNAPTFNTAIVLSGRRSLMRYGGHLASYGIDFGMRENELKRIYAGDATAEILLEKYNIEYVLISPEETFNLAVNEEFFRQFPIVAEAGQYRVYKVKN